MFKVGSILLLLFRPPQISVYSVLIGRNYVFVVVAGAAGLGIFNALFVFHYMNFKFLTHLSQGNHLLNDHCLSLL